MLVLVPTDKIQIVLATAVAANQAQCYASWRDITATPTYTAGRSTGTTNSTTEVDFIPGPAASTQRLIDFISIYNADTAAITLTIKYDASATDSTLWTGVLASGERLEYVDGSGFQIKQSASDPVDGINLAAVTSEPAAPATDVLRLYSKKIAGRVVPKVKSPSGLDYALQSSLWQNNCCLWTPTTATAGSWMGTAGAGAGTYTTALPTTTNLYTAQKRARWANVVTTLNQVLGQRNTEAMFMRGNATGQGGFFFFARCGFDVWTNGGRFFAGLHTATTVVSADPSLLANTVGFCVDAADNGAISFLTRDGSAATKASTGFTLATNRGYDLFFFCPPAANYIGWRIVDLVAGTEASGLATANLPVNTTLLTAGVLASNASLTPVTSVQLGINRIYIESDF